MAKIEWSERNSCVSLLEAVFWLIYSDAMRNKMNSKLGFLFDLGVELLFNDILKAVYKEKSS